MINRNKNRLEIGLLGSNDGVVTGFVCKLNHDHRFDLLGPCVYGINVSTIKNKASAHKPFVCDIILDIITKYNINICDIKVSNTLILYATDDQTAQEQIKDFTDKFIEELYNYFDEIELNLDESKSKDKLFIYVTRYSKGNSGFDIKYKDKKEHYIFWKNVDPEYRTNSPYPYVIELLQSLLRKYNLSCDDIILKKGFDYSKTKSDYELNKLLVKFDQIYLTELKQIEYVTELDV